MIPQTGDLSSPNSRQRTAMNPARNSSINIQITINSSTKLALSKKSNAIEVRLIEEKFPGVLDQYIDLTPREFHICENNHSLTNHERSRLVINYLKGVASEFYLKEINPQMPYQMVVDRLRARYNTAHRKFSLQLEADSKDFDDFMVRNQI